MFYTEIELTHFEEIERMLLKEFKSPLTPDQTTMLSALLADPIQPIPDNIEKPQCYPQLMELLHSDSENTRKLSRVAVAIVLLALKPLNPWMLRELRDLIVKHETQFDFDYEFEFGTWSAAFIQALATVIQSATALTKINFSCHNPETWDLQSLQALATVIPQAPQIKEIDLYNSGLNNLNFSSVQVFTDIIQKMRSLTKIDLSLSDLDKLDLPCVQALADAFQYATKLREIHLEDNDLGAWDLPRVQALADAIRCAPVLESINLSFNDLSKWNLLCIQTLANAIRYAPGLRKINFRANYLDELDLPRVQALADAIRYAPALEEITFGEEYDWDLLCIQALADAIRYAPALTTIAFSDIDFEEWDLPILQPLINAIEEAPKLTKIDLCDLSQWGLTRIQMLINAVKNNFSLVCVEEAQNLPLAFAMQIQDYLVRNKQIKAQVEKLEEFVYEVINNPAVPNDSSAPSHNTHNENQVETENFYAGETIFTEAPVTKKLKISEVEPAEHFVESQQINEVDNKTPDEIYNEIVNLELMLQVKTTSANHYLARLTALRFELFERSWNSAHENDSPNASQDFLEALPWCLDANNNFIACNEQQQKFFDACLAKALGAKLNLTDSISAQQRIKLLKYFWIKHFGINPQAAEPVAYSPKFYQSATLPSYISVDNLLAGSTASENRFNLLIKNFINFQDELAKPLYDAIKQAELNLSFFKYCSDYGFVFMQ